MNSTHTTPSNTNWRRSRSRIAGLVAAATLAGSGFAVVAAGDASAKGREVIRTGSCSNGASWKLKAKEEDGNRIEVEFEVDTNRVGQRWLVSMSDNGSTFYSGTRYTLAPSGSFSVERLTANRAGTDIIRARAVRPTTGATCVGSLSF